MQTLNVSAVRTDNEYKAANLLSDSRSDANTSSCSWPLVELRSARACSGATNIFVNIGAVDLLTLYGEPLGRFYSLAVYGAAATWLIVLLGVGFAGRAGHGCAFLAGMALWFQGQKAPERSHPPGHLDFLRALRKEAFSVAAVQGPWLV
jgi:hypothetical protein